MIDLKLKDLRYLVAVADERHFGRAAAKCFVSQPTLSSQLRKLEETLGVQLVERRPRQVTLTEAGEAIAERARNMLQSGEAIVSLAQARRDPLAGSLRVGLLPTVGPYLLPLVALKLRRSLPRLELLLYEYQTAPMLERLAAGELDVGIVALPAPAENLAVRELYREPFMLALPQSHALAAKARVRVEDLAGETLLLLEDGHCLREQALEVCSRSGGHEKHDFRATSIETLRQMVAAGAGVTLLPTLATRGAYASARGVALRAFVRPEPSRLIGAVWRRSSARGAAIDAVCDEIVRHCGLAEAAAAARARSVGG
ncbi:MAG TPA: LysR substrate-binding domain-containing protein [Steroidobacteraceae bacterium]|jgi:LysR family hydrogen peroxide-inducible transcriptional activator|nr:LysR substrate-binding domain-containing protein [Steroidobacteraceae bacterium]